MFYLNFPDLVLICSEKLFHKTLIIVVYNHVYEWVLFTEFYEVLIFLKIGHRVFTCTKTD